VIELTWGMVGGCKDGRRCFQLNDSVTLSQIMSFGVGPHTLHIILKPLEFDIGEPDITKHLLIHKIGWRITNFAPLGNGGHPGC
jgi:hypothetical protein